MQPEKLMKLFEQFVPCSECGDLSEYQRNALDNWCKLTLEQKQKMLKPLWKQCRETLKKQGVRGENIHRWSDGLPLVYDNHQFTNPRTKEFVVFKDAKTGEFTTILFPKKLDFG